MVVENGEQNTEFGIIPCDWESISFGDVITVFSSGATPYRGKPKYYNGNVRWITSGELNYNTIYDTEEKISEEAVRDTNLREHPEGTFLIAITGLEAAGTRGRCGFVGRPSTTNQSCMALYVDPKLLDGKFLYHFYVWQGQNLAFKYCQGTKQQSYTASIAKKLPIILPPVPEQKAIAEVLSDTDTLIQSLEKQIAKKRLIKQGAMQKLLSPKEGWEEMELGAISHIQTGNKNNQDKISDGKYPFFVRSQTIERINSYSYDCEAILIPGEGGIGNIFHYINGKFDVHQRVYKISGFHENVFGKYIYLYMKMNFGSHALKNTVKATVDSLRLPTFLNFTIHIPHLQMQHQIVDVLFGMESEIEQLYKKLHKLKLIRQGLMQNLLTGKIRLNLS